jgi:acylphosphatase
MDRRSRVPSRAASSRSSAAKDFPVAKRAHVTISGRVQGVGFRYATRRRAQSAGLDGWVRNNADGTVEAVFEGEREQVDALVAWCRRGPSGARVDDVRVELEAPSGERGFRGG